MTMASLIAARLLALALLLAGALAAPASAHGDACTRYRQNRLVIGDDMQSRRFVLEATGEVERMPAFRVAEGRTIFHRRFALSLDIVERVSLFESSAARTLVIARDRGRPAALQIPVFFVGRLDESLEELQANSENLAFAPSASLDVGASFSDVSFHLKRGGSRFSDIKPFFVCGMSGLLVCEQSCPEDSVTLAASLVNELVRPKPQPPVSQPQKEAFTPTPEAPLPQRPSSPPQAQSQAKPQAEPSTAARRATDAEPARPAETKKPETPPAAIPPTSAQQPAPPAKAPEASTATPPPDKQAAPELNRLVLVFERKPGEPIPAEDVVKAEGDLSIEGAPMTQTPEGLAAGVPDETVQKASDPDYLQRLFRHHRILSVKKQQGRILLTVEPLYVKAEWIAIEVQDANGEPARGCAFALNVSAERRLGPGWAKLGANERLHGLEYAETDSLYLMNQPHETEPNDLLISTAAMGNVAHLSNTAPGCELEPRPWVTAEEIKTGRIRRALAKTGPVLISIVLTENGFAGAAGLPAVEGYWTEVLKLINAVSSAPFERKVLARAQAVGPSYIANVMQIEREGVLAAEDRRVEERKELTEGSRSNLGPRSLLQTREPFFVDLAMKTIRDDASISLRHSAKQETLLFVSGRVEDDRSDFCQYWPQRKKSPWVSPQWAKQLRKAFALEIWSDAIVREMQAVSRIKAAEDAPEGVFACNVANADGDKIALYGISPQVLTEADAKAKAFAYLTERAGAFLKP